MNKALYKRLNTLLETQTELIDCSTELLILKMNLEGYEEFEPNEIKRLEKAINLIQKANKFIEPVSEKYYQKCKIDMLYGTAKDKES